MKTLILFTILNLSPCMAQSKSDIEAVNDVIIKCKGKWLLSHDHNTVVQGLNSAEITHDGN